MLYDAMQFSGRKTDEAFYGSPFRRRISLMTPDYIRRYCPNPARILDIGCGSGRYALFFLDVGVRGTYMGVDITEQTWEIEQVPDDFVRSFTKIDAHRLSRLGGEYDFAISLTAYEHFEDDRLVTRELAAVLAPGGRALIVVPATWSYPLYGRHGFRRYTQEDIRELARGAGLELRDLRPMGGFFSWVFHFLWFFPAHALRLALKTAIFAAFGFRKSTARVRWPRLLDALDRLGNWHLGWALGRSLHKWGLLIAEKLDRIAQFAPVGYIFLLVRSLPADSNR
ncbi:MAG: class I SAM-dependent methyltransferase [Deltaproteobacteria bacterium]|nr:class I SAM-dependent methyltransferase [Deltaproteobacteria bacterium]